MKLITKNYDDDTVTVRISRLEAAAIAAVYGEKDDYETIELVAQDYGEDIARQVKELPENEHRETALFTIFDMLDDIAKGSV